MYVLEMGQDTNLDTGLFGVMKTRVFWVCNVMFGARWRDPSKLAGFVLFDTWGVCGYGSHEGHVILCFFKYLGSRLPVRIPEQLDRGWVGT